jgi:phage terminase large subunit
MILDITAHDKQLEALEILTQDNGVDELSYGGAKNGGKSYLGVTWVFGSALTYPNTRWFIARSELNDLRKHTKPTVSEFFRNNKLVEDNYCKYNGNDNFYQLVNGSQVYFLECKYQPRDPMYERFGSMQFTGGWIEEGGEVDYLAYENIKLSIGRWMNDTYKLAPKLLITCNPKKNWLYTDFYKLHAEGKLPANKRFIQALVTDNTFRQSNAVKVLDNIKDRITRMRLRFGMWEYENDPSCLLDYDDIISIFSNTHVQPEGQRYMTVDVARFGKDKVKIRVWHGWVVIAKATMSKVSTDVTSNKIKEWAIKYKVPTSNIVVDADGIGGGVVDQVRGCRGFMANSSPINPRQGEAYSNLKTQCAYKLKEKVERKEIYEPEDDEEEKQRLIEDLEQIKEKNFEKEGKRMLVPKDEIKKLLGRSPDDGDSYIMRAYFELFKGSMRVATTY